MDNPPEKSKVTRQLLQIKREVYRSGSDMRLTVGDLEWFFELKKRGGDRLR